MMSPSIVQLGPLRARLVGEGSPDADGLVCVLAHGYGAPGDDLVPFAEELIRRKPALRAKVRFVFPEAPIRLAMPLYDARAWWPLDVERIQRLILRGAVRDLAEEVPEGLAPARKQLLAFLDEVERHTGVPRGRTVLGGFSQGAMLTTDVTLRADEAPAALVILSGTLLAESQWRARAPRRVGLRVLQSHGRTDPLLPFFGAEALRDLLGDAGLQVEFVPFEGPHTVSPAALARLAALLEEI